MHLFFRAFKKCAAPVCTNSSGNDAASTSETAASITAPLASASTASPAPQDTTLR